MNESSRADWPDPRTCRHKALLRVGRSAVFCKVCGAELSTDGSGRWKSKFHEQLRRGKLK